MAKMLDMTCPSGSCGDWSANGITRPLTAVPGSAAFEVWMRAATSDATLIRSDATSLKLLEAGVLKALGLYRKLIDAEIGRASENGARWWSRRLVEMYEEAGFVHLEN